MADPIKLTRTFSAPVDRVYEAWSTPRGLCEWAWGSIGRNLSAEVDLRVGGAYSVSTALPGGERWAMHGTYSEVTPRRRLAYSVRWTAPMGYPESDEHVTVDFIDKGESTKVVFVHDGVPTAKACEVHIQGWENTFDRLEHVVGPGRTVPDWYYSQAATVPYRETDDGEIEILLITNRSRKKWILPKGVIDQNLTAQEAAAKESWEEAGVRGEIPAEPIGSYSYKKWGGICKVSVFAMRVTECVDDWPEADMRDRRWLSPRDAQKKATLPDVQGVIGEFAESFAEQT